MSAGPAHRVQSAVVEYGYPQGHLGHLSADEEAAFSNFKLLCAEKEYYKPAEGEGGKPSHDDAQMLRFLRARRFVVSDAFAQFQSTEDWRKANQLDELYETIDLEQYEDTRRLYPQWTGRRDRRGIPIYVYEVKYLNAKTMAAYEKSAKDTKSKAQVSGTIPPKLIRLFALYENLTRFVMPLCTALTDREHPRTPITQSNNIVDISGVGLKQFWNLRSHMQDASTLATAHYPETLDRIFIIGAPAFFPTVWGWIKKWFDPITTSKIFIIAHADVKTTLETFIDPINIPKKYGGQLDYEFGEFPNLDPAIKDVVEWQGTFSDFPQGPKFWVDEKSEVEKEGQNKIRCIAVGSENDVQRKQDVCVVTRTLEPVVLLSNAERGLGSELLNVPTAQNSTYDLLSQHEDATAPPLPVVTTGGPVDTSGVKLELNNGTGNVAVDKSSLTPPRPQAETFVTAPEGIQTLSLDDKTSTTGTNDSAGNSIFAEKLSEGISPSLSPALKSA